MKIVLFTKLFKGCSAEEIGRTAAGLGFDGLDLAVRAGQCVTPANVRRELPAALRTWRVMGLSVAMVTPETHHTDPRDKELEEIYAACREAGVPYLKLGYWKWKPGDDYRQGLEAVRRTVDGFARLGEKHDLCNVWHVHSGDLYGSNVAGAMALIRDLDPRFTGLYLDPAHQATDGESTSLALAMAGEHLRMVGVKNIRYAPKEDGRWEKEWCPLSAGLVHWPDVIGALQTAGYDGPLSFHAEYTAPPGHATPRLNRDEALRVAAGDLQYLKELIAA